jgi:hypothetical protein
MSSIGSVSVTVSFDGSTTPPTFTYLIDDTPIPDNTIQFPAASDQAVVVTLTLVSAQTVSFPTLAANGQNAIVWNGPAGQYSQTAWTRMSDDTIVLTALAGATQEFSYNFTLWVNLGGDSNFSSDPSIANADIPPVDVSAPAAPSMKRAA